MIAFILSNLTTLIPIILGLFGITYGAISGKVAAKAKDDAAQQAKVAKHQTKRAEVAEDTRDYLIMSEKIEEKKVSRAITQAKINRDAFFL